MGSAVRLEGIVDRELAADNVETAARVLVHVPQSHLCQGMTVNKKREMEGSIFSKSLVTYRGNCMYTQEVRKKSEREKEK